jgi:tetratricopeptide (TPR) repeat protein
MTAHTRTPQPRGRDDCARVFAVATGLQRLGKLKEADQLYRRILAVEPDHFAALCGLASTWCRQGQLDAAIALFRRAAIAGGPSAEAQLAIARMLGVLGQLREATVFCRAALAFAPDHAEAHFLLANMLCMLERRVEAIGHYERTLLEEPAHVEAHKSLGDALHALGEHAQAITHYRAAIAADPQHADAHNNLGDALLSLQRPDEAIACYRKALAIRPGHAGVHANAGGAMRQLGRLDEAAAHYRQAIAIAPDFVEARTGLGDVLHALGRSTEAILHYDKALLQRPDFAEAHHSLGLALTRVGRAAEGRVALETAASLAPHRADFHLALAQAGPFTADDPRLAAMLELELASLPEEQQIALDFALGKAFADLDLPERSFQYFVDGNALKRRRIVYDEAAALALMERVRAVFSGELIGQSRGGDPAALPVFIVGMPRSGLTLIERILAAHSAVHGAGERDDLRRIVAGLAEPGGPQFPEVVPSLPDAAFAQIAASYLSGLRPLAPRAQRIVDRTPSSFMHVGLIHLALPNARIIHARRDPVETCLSCFSVLFGDEHPYAYELGELGRAYAAYDALMAHWGAVLPDGVMLEVSCEDLVQDPERQVRRLLAHCGLDFEDACLAAAPAPNSLLRQPIYRSLVGRKLAYADLLAPLIAALAPVRPRCAQADPDEVEATLEESIAADPWEEHAPIGEPMSDPPELAPSLQASAESHG